MNRFDQPEPPSEDLEIYVGNLTVAESLSLIDAMHRSNQDGLTRVHRRLVDSVRTQYTLLKYHGDADKRRLAEYAKREAEAEMREDALQEKAYSEYSDHLEDTDNE